MSQAIQIAKSKATKLAWKQTIFWTFLFGLTSLPLVAMSQSNGWFAITILPLLLRIKASVCDRHLYDDLKTTGTKSGDLAKFAYLPHLRPTFLSYLAAVAGMLALDLVIFWIFASHYDVSHQTMILLSTLTIAYVLAFISYAVWVARDL